MVEEHNIIKDRNQAFAISCYVFQIATVVRQIVPTLPTELAQKLKSLEKK